ncbi:hypothetical protein [Lacimicrobium alkaliphilum]|uniref:Cardiolipin synthase N-terminal domain-containing protein n=1 Tax=Lacimicrobium alkaliphilum TaxID=1526571 RepID=A0ABQ1RC04_9ALTE|nr:hypothetical protein [Lacimicrobium alkaliphilum]GGD62928.1 hypothetical protein GCM10011357_17760 [Lacimicrobium alkaliphilum]
MTVFYIIGFLFLALVIIIPLLERSKVRMSDEQMGKISRWVWPLVMILLITQMLYLVFSN